jgi:galactokinase
MNDFRSLFERSPTVTAQASGRVNLIGEHTDYNGGFVLPTAIPQVTRVELAPRDDQTVRAWSSAMVAPSRSKDSTEIPHYELGKESPGHGWLDFIQGVTRLLAKAESALQGFDARIESNVPLGSGLSSSASLTVAVMRALRSAFGLKLDEVSIALLGQRVENEFVGARVGIMDPMAASLADQGTALFLDCRSLEFERVPLPEGIDLIVLNSGISHQHSAGDYNTRRAECEKTCTVLGVGQLRDLSIRDLDRMSTLPEPLCRRAKHVVTENDRVGKAVAALKAGDLRKLGELFYASHASMRDDYQVSIPEIDLIVELARSDSDVYGARLTGGGFGGSVVMLARAGAGRTVAERIASAYAKRSGQQPKILVPEIS